MRTSDLLLRQVRRAITAAFLLGGFAVLVQLAIPLIVLHAVDSAIPARGIEAVALLAILAATALLTRACLNAARSRILLRAGLWAEHTLGSEILRAARTTSDNGANDLAALARLRRSTTNGSLLAILDAPWQILMIGGIALIDWRLAAVAAIATVAVLVHGWLALHDVDQAEAAASLAEERTLIFSHTLARPTGSGETVLIDATLPNRWERVNREHVAHAYALAAKAVSIADFARFVRATAQACALALGAWLAIDGELTLGALVAALVLLWCVLEPMEKLVDGLPSLAPARAAWLRLNAMQVSPAPAASGSDLPLLRISGPLAAGIAAVAAFLAIGFAIVATTDLGRLVHFAGSPLFETRLTSVVANSKGTSAQVFVKPGALVSKGDLLATLETRTLDTRITTLKLQAATTAIELGTLRQDRAAKSNAPPEKLDARIAELERHNRDLLGEIASAEEEVARSRIIAPISGRVVSLGIKPGMPVEIQSTLATLIPADASILALLLVTLEPAFWSDRVAAVITSARSLAQVRN